MIRSVSSGTCSRFRTIPFPRSVSNFTVRAHKIIDSISFFQEFGIRGYIKLNTNTPFIQFLLDSGTYFLCSTYRNRTLCDYQYVLLHVSTNGTGNFEHITEISTSIFVRRRTNGTENNVYLIQAALQ